MGLKLYYDYFKERFPLPGVILYAGSLYWISYSFAGIFSKASSVNNNEIIPGLIVFFLIFLHLRLFDEHKDFDKDREAYPTRMLSRGAITLKQLRCLLFPAIIMEIFLSFYLGLSQGIVWIMIFLWTLLMLKEFFVPDYLNKRIVLYLISHQILVPLMMLFPISQRIDILNLSTGEIFGMVMLFTGSMCLTVTYEMARKIWSSNRENEHADSYSKEWGINKALWIVLTVALSGNILMAYTYRLFHVSSIYILINSLFFLVLLIMAIRFKNNPTDKNSKILEIAGALYMLAVFIFSATGFTLQT